MSKCNIFRDGKVHVMAAMCKTCIFRSWNLMHLDTGRVSGMVKMAKDDGSAIICHSTLDTDSHAVCRGFYDRHETLPLRIAKTMECLEFQA